MGEDEVSRVDGWHEVVQGRGQHGWLRGGLWAVKMDALLCGAHRDPLS